ncbi:hypothetical protein C1645_834764 [Glomus cerebriforme]|uniref:Uncharacterized protein n=1 Tax=Glomus cerebriforme TaxID=658196 RepID=A0A397SEY5_9GLOM|nr:hypothetical protein C1645_834764 [Glomus cerebriforme]
MVMPLPQGSHLTILLSINSTSQIYGLSGPRLIFFIPAPDDDDSEWDDEINLNENRSFKNKLFELIWFDKYRPNGSFTKAAKGIAKITNFMNKSQSISDDFEEVLDNMEGDKQNQHNLRISKNHYLGLNITKNVQSLNI